MGLGKSTAQLEFSESVSVQIGSRKEFEHEYLHVDHFLNLWGDQHEFSYQVGICLEFWQMGYKLGVTMADYVFK